MKLLPDRGREREREREGEGAIPRENKLRRAHREERARRGGGGGRERKRRGTGGRERAPISRNSYQEMEMTDKAAPTVFNVTLNPPSGLYRVSRELGTLNFAHLAINQTIIYFAFFTQSFFGHPFNLFSMGSGLTFCKLSFLFSFINEQINVINIIVDY